MFPKTPERRLSHTERAKIHALRYNAGWALKDISHSLGVPVSTVSLCLHSQITPAKPPGRCPKLNTPIRQRLVEHATCCREQRFKPFEQIAQELGIHASSKTLHKAFEKEGYYRRLATQKPLLTQKHIDDRLFWAQLSINWEQDIWNRVIWSDEASFSLKRGQIWVTRRAEEKYLPACLVPKYRDYSCVMVWACIGGDGSKGPLVIWDTDQWGTLTSESYTQRVLPLIKSFKMEHDLFRVGISNSLLMQDNAGPHRALVTKQAFHQRAIRLLWWPANSPDLNPIENVWRLLKARVQKHYLDSKESLIWAIQEEWDRINLQDIKKYCINMKERCEAVQRASGGHTPF